MDKATILASLGKRTVVRDVTGVGPVRIRELSAPDVARIRDATGDKKEDFGFRLVLESVVGDDDTPVFTDADLDDLRAAAQSRIGALITAVLDINGFSADEQAAKNE